MARKKVRSKPQNENLQNDIENIDNENIDNENIDNPLESIGFTHIENKSQVQYANYSEAVYDFIQSVGSEGNFKVKIVRMGVGVANKARKQVDFFENYIPDEHEIGLKHGAGRYQVYLSGVYDRDGKRQTFIKEFDLDDCYNDYQREHLFKTNRNNQTPVNNISQMVPVNNNNNGIQDSLNIIKELFGLMLPIINNQNTSPMNELSALPSIYKNVNKAMAQNMLDAQQYVNDTLRNDNNLPEVVDNEQEATGLMGVINQVLPLFEQLAPAVLAPKPVSAPVIATIQNHPEYKRVIRDNQLLTTLIKELENTQGAEKIDKILKRLNIKRPIAKRRKKVKEKV